MKRTALTKQAPHPSFSHGIVLEGRARLVGLGDRAAQVRQAIENIRTLLRQAAATSGTWWR